MDKLKKFELMEKIVRELEDVNRSQQAVLEKVGKIEVENIELGDKRLEKILPDIYQRTADNLDSLAELLTAFSDKTDNYAEKHKVDKLKEQQDIDNL